MWLKYRSHMIGFGIGFIIAGVIMMFSSFSVEVFEEKNMEQTEGELTHPPVSIDTIVQWANDEGYKVFPASELLFTQEQLDYAVQEKLSDVRIDVEEQTVKREMAIAISPGMTVTQVSHLLVDIGYLTDPQQFIDVLREQQLTDRLRIGIYSFADDVPMDYLIEEMTSTPQ